MHNTCRSTRLLCGICAICYQVTVTSGARGDRDCCVFLYGLCICVPPQLALEAPAPPWDGTRTWALEAIRFRCGCGVGSLWRLSCPYKKRPERSLLPREDPGRGSGQQARSSHRERDRPAPPGFREKDVPVARVPVTVVAAGAEKVPSAEAEGLSPEPAPAAGQPAACT